MPQLGLSGYDNADPQPLVNQIADGQMTITLEQSYRQCQMLAKRTARNFYYSFLALPGEQFRAMCALYAFMRITDDWGDDDRLSLENRSQGLDAWRERFLSSLDSKYVEQVVSSDRQSQSALMLPAICDTVRRYRIDRQHLLSVIEGVKRDLTHGGFDSFAELAEYCRLVAGVVGLCCLPIWGCHDPAAEEPALACGLAFQLTNILRDLKEDGLRGRCYIPQEDLSRFSYTREMLAAGELNDAFMELMSFEMNRARSYYEQARALTPYLNAGGRAVFETMFRVYSGLLDEIERRRFDVFTSRVAVPAWKKFWWLGRSIVASRMPLARR